MQRGGKIKPSMLCKKLWDRLNAVIMKQPPLLFDRAALTLHRRRAFASTEFASFLHEVAVDEVKEKLKDVNRTFKNTAVVTDYAEFWSRYFDSSAIVAAQDTLYLKEKSLDLIIHAMSLNWANDPVGQLIQCQKALKEDGLFIGAFFGGQTLTELRQSLGQAEIEVVGGLSPRVAPMGELRDLGNLLQRAGFALPVGDSIATSVVYKDFWSLCSDLRGMGETNALQDRVRNFSRRAIFNRAAEIYEQNFPSPNGGIVATFEIIFLTGWSPSDQQPKPLKPGSAKHRLADALNPETNSLLNKAPHHDE
jgi:hypothetical protein